MPQGKKIYIKCNKKCYWNMGKYFSNCARKTVTISDGDICQDFITPEESEKRLSIKSGRM